MKSLDAVRQSCREGRADETPASDVLATLGVMTQQECAQLTGALDKLQHHQSLSSQERDLVCEALSDITHYLAAHQTQLQQVGASVMESSDLSAMALFQGDPPPLVVMRRKAIRMYPFNTKVALYYSDKLNRYFSVPYQTGGDES